MEALSFIQNNAVTILGALLAVSEVLALIPSMKSNSNLTLIMNVLKMMTGKK